MENNENEDLMEDGGSQEPSVKTREQELEERVAELEKLSEKYLEDSKRASADASNFINRATKDFDERFKYANQKLLLDLLPIMDNVEISLKYIDNSDIKSIKEGIEILFKDLHKVLEKYNMSKIIVENGHKFDQNYHEAVMLDNQPDMDNDHITEILQSGYTLGERVVRPAKVKVNKK